MAALATLAATGAFAQSSVTVYGQADAAVTSASSNANGSPSVTALLGAGRGSNFLGFMGTEDLGGGLKANFKLEAGYNVDNGTGAATNTNNQLTGGFTTQNSTPTPTVNRTAGGNTVASVGGAQGLTFNRWSYVGLSGGFGEVRVGREYTPTFVAILQADVVGANGVGNSLWTTTGLAITNGIPTYANASNGVSYETPNVLGGFGAKAAVFQGENPSTGTTGTLNAPKAGDGTSIWLYYNNGPLSAGYSTASHKGTAVARGANDAGLFGQYDQTQLYGKYNLGVALLTAAMTEEKLDGTGALPTTLQKNKSTTLGVSVPMGQYTINANYISAIYSKAGVDAAKGTHLVLQGMYALSKRTDLYATYANIKNDTGAGMSNYYGVGVGAAAVVAAGSTNTAYQVGIRHNF